MSAFTPEAARAERATTATLRTPVELLDALAGNVIHDGYPISGDMISTLRHDTRTRIYRRRVRANHPEGNER